MTKGSANVRTWKMVDTCEVNAIQVVGTSVFVVV